MAEKDYDVLVVGAGPSGATAARKLSKSGYDVGVYDKAEFPRHKTCGGLLTEKTIDLLERVFDYTVADLREMDVLDYMSRGYEVHFRSSQLAEGNSNLRFIFIRRQIFDEFLMKEARKSGADIHEGVGLKSLLSENTGIVTVKDEEVTADYVIGADGVHSRIRKELMEAGQLSSPDGNWFNNLAMGIQTYVDRDDSPMDVTRPVFHIGVINWGYGWIFPHSDRCLIGVGGLRRKNGNFSELLDEYREFLGFDDVQSKIKGHPVPYGNFIQKPYSGNTILAGDAAGMVDALSAEGIFYAQRTGELAAEAIDRSSNSGKSPGPIYQELLENHVLPEIRGSRLLRPLLFAGPQSMRLPLLKTSSLFLRQNLLELVHGERVYNMLKKRGDFRHRELK